MALLARGVEPSMAEIATEADVSRRTIYLHFPTVDQLVLDATVGLMNVDVDHALERVTSRDPEERLTVLVAELYRSMEPSLPLGRRLVKLTVEGVPSPDGTPRRGFRRIAWIEWALEPAKDLLTPTEYGDLVSALAMVIGWEAFIVLLDVRALQPPAARALTVHTACTLLRAALPPAALPPAAGPTTRRRPRTGAG